MTALSRNPVRGLELVAAASLRDVTSKLGSDQSFELAGLALRIINDLANEADRIAAHMKVDVSSLTRAVSDLLPSTTVVHKTHYLRVSTLPNHLEATDIQNLKQTIDYAAGLGDPQVPAPVSRSTYNGLVQSMAALADHLRESPPRGHEAEAEAVLADIEGGILAILSLGDELNHCFITTSIADDIGGRFITYSLRWGLDGHSRTVSLLLAASVALLGLQYQVFGELGVGLALLPLAKQAWQPLAELPPGTAEEE